MEIARIEVPPRASSVLCKLSGASDLHHAVHRLRHRLDIQRMRLERILRQELKDTAYLKVAVTYSPPAFDFIVSNYDEATDLLIIHDFEAEAPWFENLDLRLADRADYLLTAAAKPMYILRDDGARIRIESSYTSLRMLEGSVFPTMRVYSPDQSLPTLYQEVESYQVALIPMRLSLMSPNLMPFIEDMVRYHAVKLRLAFEAGQGQKRLP